MPAKTRARAKKGKRIYLRATSKQRKAFEWAADAKGTTLTDFIVESAWLYAQNLVADKTNFTLSNAKWEQFTAALDAAPAQKPQLKQLFVEKTILDK